jgi:hypothetical protein
MAKKKGRPRAPKGYVLISKKDARRIETALKFAHRTIRKLVDAGLVRVK